MNNKLNFKNIILLLFIAVIFTVTAVRAAITNITYDEAFTYTHYSLPLNMFIKSGFSLNEFLKNFRKVRGESNININAEKPEVMQGEAEVPKDLSQRLDEKFTKIGLYGMSYWNKINTLLNYVVANNHILNTLSISLVEFLFGTHYDEFAIRLPVLLFFAAYLFAVYICCKKSIISFTCAVLLLSNYYLCEYYGLARGYGMAHTLLFLACIAYILWRKSNFSANKFLIASMALLLLAASANTIVLLIFPAFGALMLFRLYKNNNLKKFILSHKFFVSLFFIIAFALTGYHFLITASGKPMPSSADSFYNDLIMSYAKMFINSNILAANILAGAVLFFAAAAFLFLIIKNYYKTCDFVFMLIIFAFTNILMQFLMHKGYMIDRVAVTFYSFIIISLNELFRSAIKFNIKKAALAICCLCLISFIAQIDVHSTRDFNDNYHCREKILRAYMTGEQYIPEDNIWAVEKFYDDKYAEMINRN